MLDEWSAAMAADCLRNMIYGLPPTGALSLLDEHTLKWSRVHPEIAEAQRAFSAARHGWWPDDPRRNSLAALSAVITAAFTLAEVLAPFGDETLPLCGRPSVYGPECRGVKRPDGTCTYGEDSHTDTAKESQS